MKYSLIICFVAAFKYRVPHDQAITLGRAILDSDREAKATLDQELSALRVELDKLVRAKKAQTAQAEKPMASFPPPSSTSSTSTFSTYAGYTQNNSVQRTPSMAYQQYYGYSYPYGQSGPYVYHNPQYATTSYASGATQATQAQPVATPVATQAPAKATSTCLPIQLPLTSLPSLQALGILPVPKAALPSTAMQPAAVLVGSTNSGATLLLEINVAMLQPAQMSGLAMLLSNLMRGLNEGGTSSAQAGEASAGYGQQAQAASSGSTTAQ